MSRWRWDWTAIFIWTTIVVVLVIFALGIGFILRHHNKTIQCDPMKTQIIGMSFDEVQGVCGEPWYKEYEGDASGRIITRLHYSGGDIYLQGYGSNNVGTHVIRWTK
jgi:hypothetical protein